MLRAVLLLMLALLALTLAWPEPDSSTGAAEADGQPAGEPTRLGDSGITLDLPADWQRLERPPPGSVAAWRSDDGDGVAALSLVIRASELAIDELFAEQLASLQRHASELEQLHSDVVERAGLRWHRLRFNMRIGAQRWRHSLLITVHVRDGERRAIVLDLASTHAAERHGELAGVLTSLRRSDED